MWELKYTDGATGEEIAERFAKASEAIARADELEASGARWIIIRKE